MTDLQTFVEMINKSNETFSKVKSGEDWKVIMGSTNIEFTFDKDGSFKYIFTPLTS